MSRKRTFEEVKELFESRGYELLETEYINNNTKMAYICNKHKEEGVQYITYSNLRGGKGCKYCAIERRVDVQRLDFETIKKAFENVGLELISSPEDYKNSHSKLKYRCPKHSNIIQETTYDSIRQGHGCYLCGKESIAKKQTYDYEFVKQEFDKRGYELLSKEYVGCKEYLEYRCSNHPDHIQRITFDAFRKGQGCRFCGTERASSKRRISKERAVAQCNKSGIEFVGFDFSHGDTYILYVCPRHRQNGIQSIHWDNLKNGQGCRLCRESKGEKAIDSYLQNHNIRYIREYRFNDCKYKRTLPFDFYIEDINIAIEFDGEQHYNSLSFGGKEKQEATDRFKEIQTRDAIKTKYCADNNIKLIRIPYWDIDNIEVILDKELNIHKI